MGWLVLGLVLVAARIAGDVWLMRAFRRVTRAASTLAIRLRAGHPGQLVLRHKGKTYGLHQGR